MHHYPVLTYPDFSKSQIRAYPQSREKVFSLYVQTQIQDDVWDTEQHINTLNDAHKIVVAS